MSSSVKRWERAEAARSAEEAAHVDRSSLVMEADNLARYLDPPAATCYPLEYAYHLLGDVRGRLVLEYGCGDGLNTLVLANRGARVVALDISPELIAVARERLAANGVASGVEFVVGSAHNLPLREGSIEVVFGMAILHHLDLALAAREVRRVLRPGGRAIFLEPVRNSPLVKAVRRAIPYKSPDVSPFERPLTDDELAAFADGYSSYRARAFTLPSTNLANIIPPLRRRLDGFMRWDAAVLRKFPSLAYYATARVVEMVK